MGRAWTVARTALVLLVINLVAGDVRTAAQQPAALDVAIGGRAVQPGEVVRINVRCDCGAIAPSAFAFGLDIPLVPVGESHWRGLVGIDLDTGPDTYPLIVRAPEPPGGEHVTELQVAAKSFPTRQLRMAPRFVDPPEAEVPRILREAETLNTLFQRVSLEDWVGPIVAPVNTRVTSNFGARSVFNGQPRSPHAGIDFSTRTGTPVAAPAGGRVALAEDRYFTGNTVVIDHGLGVYSLLAHLSRIDVKAGDVVSRGDVVGLSGATGRVTAPHLHWTVRVRGARVDPVSLIAATAE